MFGVAVVATAELVVAMVTVGTQVVERQATD
jgi:hypothetical protein